MIESKKLDKNLKIPSSMDFSYLIRKGMEYSQQLSGEIWTDYNAHDPGVTILEQLAYGMVDLGYRTNFSFEDLIFRSNKFNETAKNNTFYDSLDILTVGSTTLNDFRKLVIDHVMEVSNVWVEPKKDTIQGLYSVYLQIDKHTYDLKIEKVKAKVHRLFSQYRNLSEDLAEIIVLKPIDLTIMVDFDISKDINVEILFANMLFDIERYLNPSIEFFTYSDLEKEEIYDSPKPVQGFIKSSDLKAKGGRLAYSKLQELVSRRLGIRNVANFKLLNGYNEEIVEEVIDVPQDSFYFLNINASLNSFRLFQDGFRYAPDLVAVKRIYQMLNSQKQKSYDVKRVFDRQDSNHQFSNLKGLSDYNSIQNSFPVVYGIGKKGLGDRATNQRKAQSKQLKAYLYFYDQVLANHLSQLDNLEHFFSIDEQVDKSYFSQLPESILGLEEILSVDKEDFKEELNSLLNKEQDFLIKRNEVLNHLLARFGENGNAFFSYAMEEDVTKLQSLIHRKSKLLKNYVNLSKYRAKGVDYFIAIDSENVPEFVKKISLQLNLNYSHRKLSDMSSLGTFGIKKTDSSNMNLEESEKPVLLLPPGATDFSSFVFHINNTGMLKYLFANGGDKSSYVLGDGLSPTSYSLNFMMGEHTHRIHEVETINEYEEKVNKLISHFSTLNDYCEGFHVLDHILLRPLESDTYDFVIYDQNEHPFIISELEGSLEMQKEKILLILTKGTDTTTFKLRKTEDGQVEIYLYDTVNDLNLGCLYERYDSEESATVNIPNIIAYIKYIQQSESVAYSKIEYISSESLGKNVSSSFYSKELTIVCPNWTKRFQSSDFVQLFEKLVGASVPAHININYVYLNVTKMKDFDSLYFDWLSIRHNPKELAENLKLLDSKSYELVKLLESYKTV